MSRAACAKKAACNPPAAAASKAADDIVFKVIVPAVEAGELTDSEGDRLIMAFAENDDAYCERHAQIVAQVMNAFSRTD
jgi:hypothetical protein